MVHLSKQTETLEFPLMKICGDKLSGFLCLKKSLFKKIFPLVIEFQVTFF